MHYDAFISYASEDRLEVALPLAYQLENLGLHIWIDQFELTVGDSLRSRIDDALSRSQFGVVILSPQFFAKDWPKRELDALIAKEDTAGKVILPVWHRL